MKILNTKLFSILTFTLSLSLHGQGTFIYDQQSADESAGGGGIAIVQSTQPIGQSFTPTNSSMEFIRLFLADHVPNNGIGATIYINLRSNSITGPILAMSDTVFMPDNFGSFSRGFTNFLFGTGVSVVPGVTYYFQPVVQAGGDNWEIIGYNYNYPGGTAFFNGVANPNSDLWFREGIIAVPEPSAFSILIGSGVLFYVRRKKIQMRSRT